MNATGEKRGLEEIVRQSEGSVGRLEDSYTTILDKVAEAVFGNTVVMDTVNRHIKELEQDPIMVIKYTEAVLTQIELHKRLIDLRFKFNVGEGIEEYLKQEQTKAIREVERKRTTDSLTGLQNREGFETEMREKGMRTRKNGYVYLLVDADKFKSINDKYGHIVGDYVLRCIAYEINHTFRNFEYVPGRFGGEEILVALNLTDEAGGIKAAERLRANIEQNVMGYVAREIIESHHLTKRQKDAKLKAIYRDVRNVTVSIGVAGQQRGAAPQQLYERADEALYIAKVGRNRVIGYDNKAGKGIK